VKSYEKKIFCLSFSHGITKVDLSPKFSGVYRFILLKLRLLFPHSRLKIKWYSFFPGKRNPGPAIPQSALRQTAPFAQGAPTGKFSIDKGVEKSWQPTS